MPVPSSIADLSTTAASNSPDGAVDTINSLDNYQRAAYAFIRQGDARTTEASASTVDLGAEAGRIVSISGTTTITSFGTVAAGIWRIVTFDGALTLTHNGTSLILPGSANITTTAGDSLIAESLGSGNWVVHSYMRRNGKALTTPAVFESAEQSVPTGSTTVSISVAHGFAGVPVFFRCVLRCKTADLNYSVGDEVDFIPSSNKSGTARYQVHANATNVFLLGTQTVEPAISDKASPGTFAAITASSWRYVFRAIYAS